MTKMELQTKHKNSLLNNTRIELTISPSISLGVSVTIFRTTISILCFDISIRYGMRCTQFFGVRSYFGK